jgi:hypothetical protein
MNARIVLAKGQNTASKFIFYTTCMIQYPSHQTPHNLPVRTAYHTSYTRFNSWCYTFQISLEMSFNAESTPFSHISSLQEGTPYYLPALLYSRTQLPKKNDKNYLTNFIIRLKYATQDCANITSPHCVQLPHCTHLPTQLSVRGKPTSAPGPHCMC